MLTADPIHVTDLALAPIAEKVRNGEPLSHADGVTLFESRDLHGIGRLANFVRERLHGDKTYYNRNRHINYTNVCALSCKFCSFYRKRGEEGAYEMPVEQVIATARKAYDGGATEVHVVGGLHPWLKFDYYIDLLRGIARECPGLHVKAFTAIEIVHLSRVARMSVRDVLVALRDAGLGSLPGGGAEIFDDRVHDEAFKGKVRADKWFDVHRTAHSLGIYSNATMLYGHVETIEERVTHLVELRELQDGSLRGAEGSKGSREQGNKGTREQGNKGTREQGNKGTREQGNKGTREQGNKGTREQGNKGTREQGIKGSREEGINGSENSFPSIPGSLDPLIPSPPAFFNCMIPLSFAPEHSELGHLPGNTGLADLKTLAISRLMLNNFGHVKAFWIMQGIGLSQVALDWGCDDLDGTVVWYDITKREGERGTTHQELHETDIRRLIREAGRTPVERDTLYREVRRDAAGHPRVRLEPALVG